MTITDRLRLELLIREQLKQHGNEFYTELAGILTKLEFERLPKNEQIPPAGRFRYESSL